MILKKKSGTCIPYKKTARRKMCSNRIQREKNIKEILTDTNPPQNPILQVCYVEGGLVKTGEK